MLNEKFPVWPTTKNVNDAETILLFFDPQNVSRAQHEGEAQNVAVPHPAYRTRLHICPTEERRGTVSCTAQVPLSAHCVQFVL